MPHLMLGALDVFGVVMTIVGLGALIFFHEFGHFIACRLTGTRVDAFSIGFGPEIFGWTRGHTRYRVAWVPLGGYVKMAAENPGEARTDAPDEFPNKSFLQRLFIMANGVLFNVLLAFLLFVAAFGSGVAFQRPQLGLVQPGEPGWEAGLRPGDLVTHVNGERILGFTDLHTEVAFSSADEQLRLTVERDGKVMEVPVVPRYSESDGMPAIRVLPGWKREAERVRPGSPAALAGGQPGDVVLAIDGEHVERPDRIARIVQRRAGEAPPGTETLDLTVRVLRRDGKQYDLKLSMPLKGRPQTGIQPFEGRVVRGLVARSAGAKLVQLGDEVLTVNGDAILDLGLFRDAAGPGPLRTVKVRRQGVETELRPEGELSVAEFARCVRGDPDPRTTRMAPRARMAAERAGILPGDRAVEIGGQPTRTWNDLVKAISKPREGPISIVVERAGGVRRTIEVVAGRFVAKTDETLGYEYALAFDTFRETSIPGALATGWRRTKLFLRSVALTIRSLVTRRVSAEHVGGPITLARVTYSMLDLGWGRYLYVLAIISVNLAILNMLPIPVLDGGQIVLLCAEKLRGTPLPDRVVGYYQMIGLALILGLLALAFSNDIRMLF